MSGHPTAPNSGIYSTSKNQIIPIVPNVDNGSSIPEEHKILATHLSVESDAQNGNPNPPTTLMGVSAAPEEEESTIDNMSKPTAHLWLMGDMQYITDFLDRWEFCSCMLPLKILNAILRAYGAPMLVNNPISGILGIVAVGVWSFWALIWSLCAGLLGLIVCLVYFQSQKAISSGQPLQNAILLALAGTAIFPYLSLSVSSSLLFYGTLCGLSVLLTTAFTTYLSKVGMPSLTIPYAILAAMASIIFTLPQNDVLLENLSPMQKGLQEFEMHPKNESMKKRISLELVEVITNTGREENGAFKIRMHKNEENTQSDYKRVLLGSLKGAGKVMRCTSTISSVLMYVAIFLFSPTMVLVGGVGSFLATTTGMTLELLLLETGSQNSSMQLVTDGLYGHQGLLIAMSLGGYFFVLTTHSVLVALSGAVFSAFVTKFFFTVPFTTLPHIIVTLILLQVRVRGGHLRQVEIPYLTYPEMHRNVFNRIRIVPGKFTVTSYSEEISVP